jgi:hypothetical protein
MKSHPCSKCGKPGLTTKCYYCLRCSRENNRAWREKNGAQRRLGAVIRGSWNTEKIKKWNAAHPFKFDACEAVANYQIYTGRILI